MCRAVPAILASLAATAAAVSLPSAAQAQAEVTDIDALYEMLDPGFCMMPPAEISDAELIAATRTEGVPIPIRGEIIAPVGGTLFGSGLFNTDSDSAAVVAAITTMVVTEDEELLGLCVGLVPVGQTDHASGALPLIGPGEVPRDGASYLALSRFIARDEAGHSVTLADVADTQGRVVFEGIEEDILRGSVTLSGTVQEVARFESQDVELTLGFALDPELHTFLRYTPAQPAAQQAPGAPEDAAYEAIEELGIEVPVPQGASLTSDEFFGHEIRGPGVEVMIGDLPPAWDDVEDAIQGMGSRFEGIENVESTTHENGWLFTFEYEVPGHGVTAYAALARLAFNGANILCESMTNEPTVRDTAIEVCLNLRPLD